MNWIKKTHGDITHIAKTRKKQQEFLWLLATIVGATFGYTWYSGDINYNLLIIVAAILIVSFTIPKVAQPFLYVWMYLGRILSEITSFIILALIFIIGIIPMGFFYRLSKNKKGWINVKGKTNFDEQF